MRTLRLDNWQERSETNVLYDNTVAADFADLYCKEWGNKRKFLVDSLDRVYNESDDSKDAACSDKNCVQNKAERRKWQELYGKFFICT